jgi:hypothetical protein
VTSPGRREAWLGLAAVVFLVSVTAVSILFGFRRAHASTQPAAAALATQRLAVERKKSEQALTIVSSLATAVDSLARLQSVSGGAAEALPDPPSPAEWSSPTACMLSYLPEVQMPEGSLDFVCEETDFWSIDWKVRARVAGKVGAGAQLWNRLGPYSLAALASMRKGCCVDPPYLQAKVAGLWCGALRDTLRSFQAVPSPKNVREFETMMKCLEARGMHLPAEFSSVDPERSRDAFARVASIARKRTSPRTTAETGASNSTRLPP